MMYSALLLLLVVGATNVVRTNPFRSVAAGMTGKASDGAVYENSSHAARAVVVFVDMLANMVDDGMAVTLDYQDDGSSSTLCFHVGARRQIVLVFLFPLLPMLYVSI